MPIFPVHGLPYHVTSKCLSRIDGGWVTGMATSRADGEGGSGGRGGAAANVAATNIPPASTIPMTARRIRRGDRKRHADPLFANCVEKDRIRSQPCDTNQT